MKKLFIFLTLVMVLFDINKQNTFTLTNYFSGEYVSYSQIKETENSIDLGFCHLNPNTNTKTKIGESITINNLEISSALKTLKAKVVKFEYLNNTTIIYAYSPLIKHSVTLEKNKINLQIASTNNKTTIGWPLILGSF